MNTSDRFDPATLKIVALVARDLKRSPVFRDYDAEDIEMDLIVHLLERQSAFNPERGTWTDFVRARLRHHCRDMVQVHSVRRESVRRLTTTSLDHIVEEDEDGAALTFGDLIEAEASDPAIEAARALDVAHCMGKLSSDLREAAELLREHSQAEVVRMLGISRKYFRCNVLPAIQAAFREIK